MITSRQLYELELHQTTDVHNRLQITRVPGGWLYVYFYETATSVFVPMNHEFDKDFSSKEVI